MSSGARKYKVILIEPSQIIANGISALLSESSEFSIVAEISDLSSFESIKSIRHDIIIIDPVILGYHQQTNIRSLLAEDDESVLVGISYINYDDGVMRQYDEKINIFDSASQIKRKLVDAVKNCVGRQKEEDNNLSNREKDILTEVAKGRTNKDIANHLSISVYTVATHRKNISRKLGINSISGLTVYAIMNKMIDISEA